MSSNWIGLKTLVRKEWVRIFRIWPQTILPPAMTTALYFVIFGRIIGERVGHMGGFDYLAFITPGLIIMSVINAAYLNTVSSFFGAKFGRYIDELLVSPMSNTSIIFGYVLGAVARAVVVGGVVFCVAELFARLSIYSVALLVLVSLLAAVAFALVGLVNAIFARKYDDVTIIPTFVLSPLIYLGGVFYSVDALAPFWRDISYFNPIFHVVALFRYAFFGEAQTQIAFALTILISFIVLLYCLVLYLLKNSKGLRE